MIEPAHPASSPLTVILPTRNRPDYCAAQLRFFKDCGLAHPIVVADSSDPADAQAVRDACAGIARYLHFDPSIGIVKKLARTLREIETPFVVATPDDDVTFPHAIDVALAHLQQNPDFVAAHGYVLSFGTRGDDLDIHNVSGFTPTIAQEEPLQRLYHLIRRYQPVIWAVFRTDAFAAATRAASGVEGLIFQELASAATAALAGKIARLPVIFSMRGMEESMSRLDRVHPFFWFLQDPPTFFARYSAYRSTLLRRMRREALDAKPLPVRLVLWIRALSGGLASVLLHGRAGIHSLRRRVRNRGLTFRDGADLEQVIDLIHGIWLAHEVDFGILNHTVRRLLGDPLPAISVPPVSAAWREPADGDEIHPSRRGDRRYVWRREVLAAEPREEIAITPDEMARVERELDDYRFYEAPAKVRAALTTVGGLTSSGTASGANASRRRPPFRLGAQVGLKSAALGFLERRNYGVVHLDALERERDTAAKTFARLQELEADWDIASKNLARLQELEAERDTARKLARLQELRAKIVAAARNPKLLPS